MKPDNQTLQVFYVPRKPGTYLDRGGKTAIVETQGPDGKWHGYILGIMTSTWWYADGRHNLYPNHDLKEFVA